MPEAHEGVPVPGAEVIPVCLSEAALTRLNYARAFNRAATQARGPRIALASSSVAGVLEACLEHTSRILVVVSDGTPSRPPRTRPASAARLAAAAGRVEALVLPRTLLVEAGGLDEDLGAAVAGPSLLLADLAVRLLTLGRVDVIGTQREARMAAGQAGFATGSLLRAQSRRADAGTTKAGASIMARTLRDLVLERVGVRTRRDLTGHDLTGLLAGLTRGAPQPRPPAVDSLPRELEETLTEHGVVEARARPSGAHSGRLELFALHDADGMARLALWVRHHPRPKLRARLEAREADRVARPEGGGWVPRLYASAEVPETLVTVESLHEGGWRSDPLLAHLEAERWLEERGSSPSRGAVGEGGQLTILADEAGGPGGPSLAVDHAVERLADLPSVAQHGSLRPEVVAIGPGRTVLLGWEHWAELGLPGFDAIHLALATARRRFGEAGPRTVIENLLAGSDDPLLVPFVRDIDRFEAGELREEIILATLVLLARRERESEARFEPSDFRVFRDALEVWRAHHPGG